MTKKRILIIDDSKEIVELTKHLLEARGYEVVFSLQGNIAPATAVKCQPDLILLDMILEDKTGLELCAEIKTNPQTENIPVIITTGQLEPEEKIPDNLKPDDYLVKPFELEELLEKIKKLI